MKVKDLIAALGQCDPDAHVVIMDPSRGGVSEDCADTVFWHAYRVVEGIEQGFSENPDLMRWDKGWSTTQSGWLNTPAVKIIGHNEGEP
jgi:hypothetical protein